MRVPSAERKISGFTLVEMAIVLVIIGIILAGVMKGRDIVRGAQVKQFSQQFGQKWVTVSSTYYDKTGQFLLDGTPNKGYLAQDPDGVMDGDLYGGAGRANLMVGILENVGIAACSIVRSKLTAGVNFGVTPAAMCDGAGAAGTMDRINVVQTQVDGEYAQGQVVSMEPVGLTITFGSGANPKVLRRNCIALYGVPIDVAIGLDTLVDGTANGNLGACVYDSTSGATAAGGSGTAGGTDLTGGDPITTGPWPAALDNTNAAQVCNCILIMDY